MRRPTALAIARRSSRMNPPRRSDGADYGLTRPLFHHDLRGGPRIAAFGQLVPDAFGQRDKRARFGAVRLFRHDRRAGIGGPADGHHERDLSEEIRAERPRRFARAAMTEDVALLAAMRTMER